SQAAGTLSVVHLAQAWSAVADRETGDLWLVTRGAQAVGDTETLSLAQTPVWGLGRVMVNEYPRLRARMLDLGPRPLDGEADALVRELTAPDDEEEIALRGQARYVHRYVRCEPSRHAAGAVRPVCGDEAYQLNVSRSGTIDGLAVRPVRRQP